MIGAEGGANLRCYSGQLFLLHYFHEGSKRAAIRAALAVVCALLATTFLACSLVLGLKDGDFTGAGDSGDGGPLNDERPVLTPDASTAVCQGGLARNIESDDNAVYVFSGGSTIVSTCGSKVNPCGTIAVGIQVANAKRAKAIYIGPGTYPEQIQIPSGVSIEGGFDVEGSTWTALCENLTTTIAPTSAIVVTATGVLNAALRFLTIETKAHGDVGESLFTVVATDSALTIENVNVYAELGGSGKGGANGVGSENTNANCGENGAAGTTGGAAPDDTGIFTASGFSLGIGASTGGAGARGSGGVYTSAQCGTCTTSCDTYTYPLDDAGVPVDDAGNEITDGATSECDPTTASICASDTKAACGGHGGLPGAGGGNGAASVAVFAVGATTSITITGGALVSAGGGLGGPGGGGAPGTAGESASSGGNATCFGSCDNSCAKANMATLNGASTTSGGPGGAGGSGGGGTGGPTFLIVTVGGATVTIAQTAQWQIPIVGAAGGQPNGPSGAFGKQYP